MQVVSLTRFTTLAFLAALAAAITISAPASAETAQKKPTAQSLLFDTPYLEALAAPGALSYKLDHATDYAKRYGKNSSDTVQLRLEGEKEQQKQVVMNVISGEHKRVLGPFSEVSGNPVIMMFLERDVWQMKKRIGGTPAFYRNRIRKALRDAAKIEPASIDVDGKTLPAHHVTIQPFKGEADVQRFREYRDKSYRFTVADGVPGGFYEIRSHIPDAENAGKKLVEDTLTYASRTQ